MVGTVSYVTAEIVLPLVCVALPFIIWCFYANGWTFKWWLDERRQRRFYGDGPRGPQ